MNVQQYVVLKFALLPGTEEPFVSLVNVHTSLKIQLKGQHPLANFDNHFYYSPTHFWDAVPLGSHNMLSIPREKHLLYKRGIMNTLKKKNSTLHMVEKNM